MLYQPVSLPAIEKEGVQDAGVGARTLRDKFIGSLEKEDLLTGLPEILQKLHQVSLSLCFAVLAGYGFCPFCQWALNHNHIWFQTEGGVGVAGEVNEKCITSF